MAKIVHFGKYFPPDTGGIESVTYSLAKGAVAAGHNVTVVCFNKNHNNEVEVIDGVRVLRAPVGLLISSQPIGWRYFSFCMRESRDADIVHMHAPNMLAAICVILMGSKIRLLVHWHSDVIKKGILSFFLKPIEWLLLIRANKIIATTDIYANASHTLRPFSSKISIVPIGVKDPKLIEGKRPELADISQAIHAKVSGKRFILALGRLVPYKGFKFLIEATQYICENTVVIIVGEGPQQESLKKAIDAAGLSGRVHLVGRQCEDVLAALFHSASLFCLPSIARSEAFGVVLLEAMAYGLPIVATNIEGSGVPWVSQHGVSGINVPVGNSIALANACNQILNSPIDYAKFSEGARQRYLKTFTESAHVSQILDNYYKLTK